MTFRRRAAFRPGILAIPRDSNPYQESLYTRIRALGHRVRYLGGLTRSHSVNLLLLPFELAVWRTRGYRVLHVHWTFGFAFAGANSRFWIRRFSRHWFELLLVLAGAMGLRVVWTAHNVLPHAQVFDDDRRARRFLIRRADLVIAHSNEALRELETSFGVPSRFALIPHGPFEPPGLARTPALSGLRPRTVLFFGLIEPYKGVEDLLRAATAIESPIYLNIVGRCRDSALASRIREMAEPLPWVKLTLEFVPEEDIQFIFIDADAVVYPYRKVTTSGAVTLAAVASRPVIVPDLPAFANFSDRAAIRYPAGVDGLRAALQWVADADTEDLRRLGAGAKATLAGVSWEEIAEQTSAAFVSLMVR